MSGNSPQQDSLIESERTDAARLQQAYGIALPALGTEYASLNQALATGGEPGYLKSAYAASRGALREGSALQDIGALRASQGAKKGAVEGGNVGAISPQMLGSSMAGALYGNRVQEASGSLEQMNKLYGASLGQAQQTGSGALAATENQLANIGGMRNYNATYANILGALNVGAGLYGAGAFGQGNYSGAGWQNPAQGYGNPVGGMT